MRRKTPPRPKFLIKTDRLTLRPLRRPDYKVWREAYLEVKKNKNKYDRTLRKRSDLTERKFLKLLQRQSLARRLDQRVEFAIFRNDTGQFIGMVYLFVFVRAIFKHGMLGYSLFSSQWGKGLALEASKAVLNFAFDQFDLHRIVAIIDKDNKRSNSLARRLGMTREGRWRGAVQEKGRWVDHQVWVMLSEDRS